ncbi:MAG: FCD domain-containing protein, partial [Bradyrhizobium sp.]
VEECLALDNAEGYMQANHAFHFAISSAVPSPVLLPLIETLWLQFGPFMRLVYEHVDMTTLVDQHERAIAAIARRDAADLRAAIEADIGDGMSIIGRTALG